jgi:hypothetical protein
MFKVLPTATIALPAQLITQATAIFRRHLLKRFMAVLAFLANALPFLGRKLSPVLAHFLPNLMPIFITNLRARATRQAQTGN